MARLEALKAEVRRAYDEFDFQTAFHNVLNFVAVDLSSLYIDVARDRLYCDGARSRERRSAQTALYLILDDLVRIVAPLMPFTADEIYSYIPGHCADSVHLLTLAAADPRFSDPALEARWNRLLEVRDQVLKVLETMRQAGTIGAPLEARLSLGATNPAANELMASLQQHGASLKDLFIVSEVAILDPPEVAKLRSQTNGGESFAVNGMFGRVGLEPPLLIVGQRAPGLKCQRCWCYYADGGHPSLCPRCRSVVAAAHA